MWKEGTTFYEREEQWVKGEEKAVEFQIEYGRRLLEEEARGDDKEGERQQETGTEKSGTAAGRLLMDAGLNCLEHFLYSDWEKMSGLLEKAAGRMEDGLVKARAFWLCGKLTEEAREKDDERAKGYYDRAVTILEEDQKADAMEIWDKLAEGYRSLELYDQEELCRSRCDHELLAWQNVREMEKEADRDGESQLRRQMEIWKDSGDKSKERFMNPEESEQDRNKRLAKAAICYRQAKCLWDQMGRTERQTSLYLLGSTMEAWFDAETGKGDAQQAKNVLFQWHGALTSYWEEIRGEEENRGDLSRQLEGLAEKLRETGDREGAILCNLERGIVWLEAEGEMQDRKIDEDEAARAFFAGADLGISEGKIDEVLEICDTIAALCGGQEQRAGLKAACEALAKRYREKQISFKA